MSDTVTFEGGAFKAENQVLELDISIFEKLTMREELELQETPRHLNELIGAHSEFKFDFARFQKVESALLLHAYFGGVRQDLGLDLERNGFLDFDVLSEDTFALDHGIDVFVIGACVIFQQEMSYALSMLVI